MKLDNLTQPPFNTTMMGVLKGMADYFGIEVSVPMIYGGSGHAFLINIHEQLCPSGPYCWKYDGFYPLVRNLGLEMTNLGFFHPGRSPEERATVEGRLKAHLDAKLPCSLTNMENQLILGYDEMKFFTAQPWPNCNNFPPATLTFGSWRELGDEVHISFFLFRKVPPGEDKVIIRDSLRYAVDLFRNPGRYSLDRYGIGPQAYDNWAKGAAEFGSSHGNWWNGQVWSECRKMAGEFCKEISGKTTGRASSVATELHQAYGEIAERLERISSKEMAAPEKTQIVHELKEREAGAIRKVAELAEQVGS